MRVAFVMLLVNCFDEKVACFSSTLIQVVLAYFDIVYRPTHLSFCIWKRQCGADCCYM